MASYVSHYLAAKAVIENSEEKSVIREYADCFILGAQGGDLLFYAFGKFKGYGARTHRESTHALFSSALEYCRKTQKAEHIAYTLGLLCHYALDSEIHPYVVFESSERLPSLYPENLKKCLHMMLETRLDCLLKDKLAANGEKIDLKAAVPATSRAAKSLADVWYNAIDKLYDTDVPYKLLLKLPSRMRRYQKVFLHPASISCKVLRIAAKKLDYPAYIVGFFLPDKTAPAYDVANCNHRPYPEYTGAENTVNHDFYQIFDAAVQKSKTLSKAFISALRDNAQLSPSLFRISFSGTVSD